MARQLLALAFVLAALAPQALVSAQQSTQSGTSHSTKSSSSKSTTASAQARHSAAPASHKGHHSSRPLWSNGVYVNGGSAAQYLATSTPKPPPGKNKVKTGSGQEVFKSISN